MTSDGTDVGFYESTDSDFRSITKLDNYFVKIINLK